MSGTDAPRWRLLAPHHLNVPGTEWEYKEQDRTNPRKQTRKLFPVPLFLHPEDPSDHNYPAGRGPDGSFQEGQIIVAHAGPSHFPADIVFEGEPTPDMEPLNEAAEELTATLRKKWEKNPIDRIAGDFSASLIRQFETQMDDLVRSGMGAPISNTSTPGVSTEQFNALQAQVQALMEQNATLVAKLGEPAAPAGRRA